MNHRRLASIISSLTLCALAGCSSPERSECLAECQTTYETYKCEDLDCTTLCDRIDEISSPDGKKMMIDAAKISMGTCRLINLERHREQAEDAASGIRP